MKLMCQVLNIDRSGYYVWLKNPDSQRTIEDRRLLGLIKHSWLESGCVYGYRKVHRDLRDLGETCSRHKVACLMRHEGLQAQVGYRKRRGMYQGQPAIIAANRLNRAFSPSKPNVSWVTKTHEGWLYLAVVLELYSRAVVRWSMSSKMESELVTQTLLAAVWRRKPVEPELIHSDQSSQFTGSVTVELPITLILSLQTTKCSLLTPNLP
ncbi:IS3 family transposase [Vibrio celticus]|uniref:IS3 family transposase n=1 Tax=Vibrio celticus TaxID=446372 RepID=UPI0040678523